MAQPLALGPWTRDGGCVGADARGSPWEPMGAWGTRPSPGAQEEALHVLVGENGQRTSHGKASQACGLGGME